ncbi:MAG: hypothetical protein PF961_23330 [Planctomycetota bacterium]|jgi:hypothetical protein|nr:hypothetical protein [Planctomycetota bacterium]
MAGLRTETISHLMEPARRIPEAPSEPEQAVGFPLLPVGIPWKLIGGTVLAAVVFGL